MTTEQRIDALENTVGRQRIQIAALILMAVNSVSRDAGEDQVGSGVTETGGVLTVTNSAGKIQATLGADQYGGILSIFTGYPEGKIQIGLGVTETGDVLGSCMDAQQHQRRAADAPNRLESI